ncbi:MAG TPA: rhodanese-like domain-containing protein [Opitutus sp.]|nr:rhodanese-like domain-containing protein [Opitutus sp.]
MFLVPVAASSAVVGAGGLHAARTPFPAPAFEALSPAPLGRSSHMTVRKMLQFLFDAAPSATPAEYLEKVRSGAALLIDVRESDEWRRGVAESAALLPLSDLHRERVRWKPVLEKAGDRELLLYCASGVRSGIAARLLVGEGFRAFNAGGLSDWAGAGWPIRRP